MENEKFEFAIEFADYLNNNWYVPTTDGFWKIDVENEGKFFFAFHPSFVKYF